MGSSQTMNSGFDGQGAGDADALALAAGELVGKAVGVLLVEAHHVQQLARPAPRCCLVLAQSLWMSMPSAMISRNRHAGVQGGIGVLEDHLDVLGVAACSSLARFRCDDVLALKEDLARRSGL